MDSLALGIFLGYARSSASLTSILALWGGISLFHAHRYLTRVYGRTSFFYTSAVLVGTLIGHGSIGGVGYGIGYLLR